MVYGWWWWNGEGRRVEGEARREDRGGGDPTATRASDPHLPSPSLSLSLSLAPSLSCQAVGMGG